MDRKIKAPSQLKNETYICTSDLLKGLQMGDPKAFDALYYRYWESAYQSGFRWTKDSEIVKDALQEVFASVWLNRKKTINNLEAYLKIAVRNRIFKALERSKEFVSLSELMDHHSISEISADQRINSGELNLKLEKLVSALPPQRQKIVRLRFMEDFSTRSIAEMLEINQKTVQNQLSRAVESMRVKFVNVSLFTLVLFYL